MHTSKIVLTTFNARYIHSAFGLRYLHANLGELREEAHIEEFTINQRPIDAVEKVLAYEPSIVGVSVYIWNVEPSLEFIATLKRLRPDITVVVGGPEVSHEIEGQPLVDEADFVIAGEADIAFREFCESVLADEPPPAKIIHATPPQPDELVLPYELYDDEDVANRVIYVEASRGCPFRCEFCLSSLARGVRAFDLDRFLGEMQSLFDRGVRQFKFVDRTFNLKIDVSAEIMSFFLERYEPGLFVHFEMVPDRLPDELRELIERFPDGSLQFEVGIQTFDDEVAATISRRQNYERLADNLTFLREHTGVHVHADLIAGLPGEDMTSFGRGFDRLVALGPQEIQVGILKRLRGVPINRHTEAHEMVYSPTPPYEILETGVMSFDDLQRMRRFARYWDLVGNSGNFVDTVRLLYRDESAFDGFMEFSDWLWAKTQSQHGIALKRLCDLIFEFLTEIREHDPDEVGPRILADYQRPGRRTVPSSLMPWRDIVDVNTEFDGDLPARQARHAAG